MQPCRVEVGLAFLVPILHPERPKRVTVRLASTIIAARFEGLEVNWGLILLEVMKRHVANMKGTKGCSLTPFLYHFYGHFQLLNDAEKIELSTKTSYIRFGVEDEVPKDPDSDYEGVMEKEVSPPPKRTRRFRLADMGPDSDFEESPAETARGGVPHRGGPLGKIKPQRPLKYVLSDDSAREWYDWHEQSGRIERRMAVMETNISEMCTALGCQPDQVVKRVQELALKDEKEVNRVEAKQVQLQGMVAAAQTKLKQLEKNNEEMRQRAEVGREEDIRYC